MKATLIFLFGACVGAAAGVLFMKKECEKMKAEYEERIKELTKAGEASDAAFDSMKKERDEMKETLIRVKDYADHVRGYGYGSDGEPVEEEKEHARDPYIIEPEEFGESDYHTETMLYFSDDILADSMDNVMDDDDIETAIGKDALRHIGEFEPDAIHVRNETLEIDFEILREHRTYAEHKEARKDHEDGE